MVFITYTFPADDFDGPIFTSGDAPAVPVYRLSTPSTYWSSSPTTITRPKTGEVVGEVQLGVMFRDDSVYVRGSKRKDFVRWEVGKSKMGMLCYAARKWDFQDDSGRQFYWKDCMCYLANEENTLVADWTRPRWRLFKQNERAALSVNENFVSSLDFILVSAILIELKRQAHERRQRRAAASGGGGP